MIYYFSFATVDGFLGAIIAEGESEKHALDRINAAGINPGGEALCIEIWNKVDAAKNHTMRLMSRDEVESVFGECDKGSARDFPDAKVICEDCNQ